MKTTQRVSAVNSCYAPVHDATSRQEFHAALVGFATTLGFDTVSAVMIIDRLHGPSDFISADNTPEAFRQVFLDREICKTDPVSQHCKTTGVPIVWDRSTYLAAGRLDKWDLQSSYGYHCGISLALHLPRGRHLLVGVDRDQPLPDDACEVTRMTASLQLFSAHAYEAATRLLVPEATHELDAMALTSRELECLRWTMEGKTAWELGRILGIAEQTAVRHLYNATRKLGCSGKHHAVICALRMGLIW